jgi:hypothetical protein
MPHPTALTPHASITALQLGEVIGESIEASSPSTPCATLHAYVYHGETFFVVVEGAKAGLEGRFELMALCEYAYQPKVEDTCAYSYVSHGPCPSFADLNQCHHPPHLPHATRAYALPCSHPNTAHSAAAPGDMR